MTTSDPQADHRGDDPTEHRTIGQRIRDAVLGEPDTTRHDTPTDTGGHADPDRGDVRDVGDRGFTDEGRPVAGSTAEDRRDPGFTDLLHGGATGDADPDRRDTDPDRRADTGDIRRDPGFTDLLHGGATGDADPDRREPRYTDTDRRDDTARGGRGEDAPRGETTHGDIAGGAVPDPVRDDIAQDGTPRDVPGRGAGYAAGTARSEGDGRDLVTSSYDPDRDTGYDPHAAGTAMAGSAGTSTGARGDGGDGPDFVTSSYDPDRDTGYDPHAAGTAMAGSAAAGSTGYGGGADVRGRGARDDETDRDYDPALDTGYLDRDRLDADRRTGHRDADYDTGRVDAGSAEPGAHRDTPRAAGIGTAAAVVAGGAAAAAGVAAGRHRETRDADDVRFSEVDDTATVDDTSTGRATPDGLRGQGSRDTAADRRAEAVADEEAEGGTTRERLVPSGRAQEYSSRWDALKGDFVDEPRRAVAQADDLVGELLDEIQRLFADQRRDLEQGFDHDRASTEDLRLALRRYRSFFDRLLSF